MDVAGKVQELEEDVKDIRSEQKAQGAKIQNLETQQAVFHLKFENMEKALDKIGQNTSKLVWILVTALIGAGLRIIFKGGL